MDSMGASSRAGGSKGPRNSGPLPVAKRFCNRAEMYVSDSKLMDAHWKQAIAGVDGFRAYGLTARSLKPHGALEIHQPLGRKTL